MRLPTTLLLATTMLAGCSQAPEGGGAPQTEAVQQAPAADAAAAPAAPATAPKIAYVYQQGYTIAGDRIAAVQDRHVALCDRLGPARCNLIAMDRGRQDGGYASGALTLQVAAPAARGFIGALDRSVVDAGGEAASSRIEAEDVSKQIVDVAARIRARETLVRRLTEILATRAGTVQQLAEAEKSVAAAQEELDAARAWAAELSLRVGTSKIEVRYDASDGGAFLSPLRSTARSLSGYVGASLAALVMLVAVAAPWALLAFLVVALRRWWRKRREVSAPNDSAF